MKFRIIMVLSVLSYVQSSAQKNTIEIGVGGYKFSSVIMQQNAIFNAFSVSYSRKIEERFHLHTQYTRGPLSGSLSAVRNLSMSRQSVGKLTTHYEFNYFDIGGKYQLYKIKSHDFSITGALSLAHGRNEYLTHVVWSEPEPGEPYGHPFHANYATKKETYFGALAGLRYDYRFWNNRINIGLYLSARCYFGKKNAKLENPYPGTQVPDPNIPGGRHSFPFQGNHGIHVGYNF